MKRPRTPRLTAAVLLCTTALAFTEWRTRAAGTISGAVFEDFNGNGVRDTSTTIPNNGVGTVTTAVDRGVGGVTVTVYDGTGAVQGTASTTAANGSYSIAATGTGPYRVEFTTLPAGYQPTKYALGASGNGTTVQFVLDGNTADVNLGILDPANFCQNNPSFVISCYVFGSQTSPPNNLLPVLVDFPYSAGATGPGATAYFQPTDHTLMVPAQSVGTTYGMAYSRPANTIYTSAFMKKHAGFGPNGTGAIYAVNPGAAPGGAPVLFADLNTLFGGAGPNLHNVADYSRDNGDTTWNAVGKVSLGGLEVSPDGAFVYVVNLFDRHVYRLPTGAGAPQRVPIPVPAGVAPGDMRPFALQWYKGLLYVGLVDSAESTQDPANLRGFVYTLDPVTLAFGAAPAFQFPLNYPRGVIQQFNSTSAGNWLPWTSSFATNWPGAPTSFGDNVGTYPQPWLTGLSFDVDGNMTIGLRDRAGDQFGFYALSNPSDSFLWLGVAGGDTLLAEANVKGNPAGGWTLESNAATASFGPTAGAGTNQGPGGGEYFFGDFFVDPFSPLEYHQETTQGAVLQVPGFPDVMSTSMNPGRSANAGGVMWLSRLGGVSEGSKTKGYNLYSTPGLPDTFSKTNGLGEFVAVCQAAPIEIGNRVWDDVDGDGVQDANEPGLDGVTVQLIAPGGGVLASVVTANGGQYYFSSETIPGLTPNTAGYIVRIVGGQPALGGRNLTIANSDGTANGDSRDSDASTVLGNAEIVVATGPAGNNNHTYDFGFTLAPPPSLSLGNFVWFDTNNNGLVDAGEQPITGVDVVLYADNGNGTFDALSDTVIATQTTAAGLYLFTGLPPGNYFVQIPALEFGSGQTLFGYLNSTGQNAGDVDNVDHGAPAPIPGQGIVSNLVTLTVGGEPGVPVDGDGTNSNLTIDFGFYKLSLGNFVFFDPDNSGTVTVGDTPAAGRPVELLNNVGTVLQTTITDAAGLYSFSGLAPGDYAVRITPPAGYTSSTGPASAFEPGPDPDNNVDNDDNGSNSGGTITSALVTLTPGAEPIVTNATGETSNPTVDFGLIQVPGLSLGNLVWLDANNDGIAQPAETGINNVTVRLLNGPGTVQLATQQTAGGGFYLFTGLAAGDYVVEVVIPTGLTSSTGAGNFYEPAPDPDTNINNDDNGTTQSGGVVVRSLPVTLALNSEPIDDGDTDPNSNLTVDFGFFSNSLCLGNLVWLDVNNNGVADPGETGISGVTMRLIGADGVTVIATTTTDANGNYQFCGLQPGTYFVEVDRTSTAITGLPSSTDISTSGNPDNDVDNDDNGVNVTTLTVRSNAITLTFGGEPVNDGDTNPNTNLSVDFGFVPTAGVSLGNLVWADDNDNALVDPGELGIPNIPVRLIAANGTTLLASTTTNANGNYLFAGLQPGTYFVEITAPVVGVGDQSSSTDIASSANPNNDLDNDDNGIGVGFGNGTTGIVIRSAAVTLTLGGEPINDGDTNPNSNLTVDFGIPGGFGGGLTTACLGITSLPKSIQAGVQFTSTFAAENQGPFPAKNMVIEGMLPPGLTVVATTPSPGGTCTLVGTDLKCTWLGLTGVGPAAKRTVDVTFVANLPNGTPVWLWFMTETGNPAPGSEACGVIDGYPFVVDGTGTPTDLAITAVASSSSQLGGSVGAPVNQPVRARFAVTNRGTVPARGRYEILLDNAAGLTLTSATLTQGQASATGATTGAWETDFIAPGVTAALDLTFVPSSSGVTRVTAIRSQGTPTDPDATNDTASFVIDGIGSSSGGRFVAAGNVDGVAGAEIITGAGPGEAPQVRVFSGAGGPIQSFYAFARDLRGGVRVASCDVNGDGRDEIVAATGPGAGRVRVVSLAGGTVTDIVAFDAFENAFTGGVNVACADVDADGRAEVVVAPEGGRAPDVRVFDVGVRSAVVAAQFQAYESTFTGGVRVAAAPFTGSGLVGPFQVATMPGPGRAGEVRTWSVGGGTAARVVGAVVAPSSGARIALGDADGNGAPDLLVMPDGGVGSLISIYSLTNGAVLFTAPSGAAGFRSLDATVGTLVGATGPEVVVGRGPGQSPDVITFRVLAGGAILPRLVFTALEVP